ncbi:hypothetical protein NHX12_014216, partial [Muraenolepis orangiensis]
VYVCEALGPSLVILGALLLYSPLQALHAVLGSAAGTLAGKTFRGTSFSSRGSESGVSRGALQGLCAATSRTERRGEERKGREGRRGGGVGVGEDRRGEERERGEKRRSEGGGGPERRGKGERGEEEGVRVGDDRRGEERKGREGRRGGGEGEGGGGPEWRGKGERGEEEGIGLPACSWASTLVVSLMLLLTGRGLAAYRIPIGQARSPEHNLCARSQWKAGKTSDPDSTIV